MKMSPQMARAINDIIQEEVQDVIKGRKLSDSHKRRAVLQERLLEAGPDAMRVDDSIISSEIGDMANDIGLEISDYTVRKFRTTIVPQIAVIMNQHAMSSIKIDPRTFLDELEEFDQDVTMELAQECISDMTAALEKYAIALGGLAVNMAGGGGE